MEEVSIDSSTCSTHASDFAAYIDKKSQFCIFRISCGVGS